MHRLKSFRWHRLKGKPYIHNHQRLIARTLLCRYILQWLRGEERFNRKVTDDILSDDYTFNYRNTFDQNNFFVGIDY